MADEQTFELLLSEFRRVGVDPDTFSAMLALRPEDALRALRALSDGAGPAAFLAQLRKNGITPAAVAGRGADATPPPATPDGTNAGANTPSRSDRARQRRDKTA